MQTEVDMVKIKDDKDGQELVARIADDDWVTEGEWLVMPLDTFSYIADTVGLSYDELLLASGGKEFYRTVEF